MPDRVRVGRNAVDPNENMVRYVNVVAKGKKEDANAVCADHNYFREYRIEITRG